jgi:predicted transcriptional regulator
MKRTTIYLDPELEIILKIEAMRRKQPMAEIIRDALRQQLANRAQRLPPGAGAFASGHEDTAERNEELLKELGFAENSVADDQRGDH